jgi:hypothetical protein
MNTNGHCKIHGESSLPIGQGRRVNGYRPSATSHLPSAITTESMNVSLISRRERWDVRCENESENDRIRNRIDNDDYNDMLDIMEWEYTFCRGSRRCDIADCVTFYAASIKFRYFFDCLFWPFEETWCLHARRHRDPRTWRDRQTADTVEENELRGSQLSPISQISMSQSTFYMIDIIVITFWRLFIWFTYF